MSKISIRNDFLSFYRMSVTGKTYYVSDKYTYKVEQVNKAVKINNIQYKVTDQIRNSAQFEKTMSSARRAFVNEKNKLLQSVMECADDNIDYIGSMYSSVANGCVTFFSDFVKLLTQTPVSEVQLNKVCILSGKYSTNTYNELMNMQSNFVGTANGIFRNTGVRLDNYNAQTQAQFDAVPKFGIFSGTVHSDLFGNTHVFGGVITDTSRQYAESYVAMAQNKVAAELHEKEDLARLKEEAVMQLDDFVVKSIKDYRAELFQLLIDEIDDVFDYEVFCEKDLVYRPFDGKLWQDYFAFVSKEDFLRLKYIFDFYDISYNDYLQTPLFDKLIAECGINGNFDAYDCKEKDIYFFFKNYTSVKDEWYFGHYLTKYIKEKIDAEYEQTDISLIGKTDELFDDIYKEVQASTYLNEEQKIQIRSHIHAKKANLIGKRGY